MSHYLSLFKLTFILVGFGLAPFAHAQSSTASMYRLTAGGITITPALGQVPLPNYLVKFGIFQSGFAPTPNNLSLWDSNFTGVTASYSGSQINAEFFASDNLAYPVGAQFYIVAYDIAPTAAISTATKGIILTRTGWNVGEAVEVQTSDGRRQVWRWQNYWYESTGFWSFTGNFDEHNTPPFFPDPENYSSPVNILTVSGSPGGYTLTASFDMVPEPSSASLGLAGLAGVLATRRRK